MGYVLHGGAIISCRHVPGLATPITTDSRVTVSGQPVVAVGAQYSVDGCGLTGSTSSFCKQGSWLSGATRVSVSSGAVAIDSGTSFITLSGSTFDPQVFQRRVTAT
jgi:hypothetical protein